MYHPSYVQAGPAEETEGFQGWPSLALHVVRMNAKGSV